MDTSIGDALTQAYDLIEAEKLDEARAILKPILETAKGDPDAWWLYAHAVTDTEAARLALNNVLRIDSEYPEAAQLLKNLEQKLPAESGHDFHKEPSFLPPAPPSLPDLPESGDEFDDDSDLPDDFEDDDTKPLFQRSGVLLGLFGLILVIALVIVLVRPFGGNQPPTTPVVTEDTTLSPTIEGVVQDVPTASSPVGTDFTVLNSALSDFLIPDNGINLVNTSLGNTVLVDVCTTAGQELRTQLPLVMSVIAKASGTYVDQVAAVGTKMIDCSSNTVLRTIGVSISDAAAYTNGSLAEKDFPSRWKAIR